MLLSTGDIVTVDGLQIHYRSVAQSDVAIATVNASRPMTFNLTSLKKFVVYQIQMLAYTAVGDGAISLPAISVRTFEDGTQVFCSALCFVTYGLEIVQVILSKRTLPKLNALSAVSKSYLKAIYKLMKLTSATTVTTISVAVFQVNVDQQSVLGFFFHSFHKGTIGNEWLRLLQHGCPYCYQTNSISALKETQCFTRNQWEGLVLSLPTTGLLKKEALLP